MSESEGKIDDGKLREYHAAYHAGSTGYAEPNPVEPPEDELVRTQVYLSASQREFLQEQGRRTGVSMAAALRQVIDSAMKPAASSWMGNPLLDDVVVDASFHSTDHTAGVGSESTDAAIYGEYQP